MELMPGAAELAEAFARDGVVCVRSALDPGEVATAVRGIEAVLADVRADLPEAAGAPDGAAGLLEAHTRLLTFVRGYALGLDAG